MSTGMPTKVNNILRSNQNQDRAVDEVFVLHDESMREESHFGKC